MNPSPNTPRTKAELEAALADAIAASLETHRQLDQAQREIARLGASLAAADEQIAHLGAVIDVALEEQDFLRDRLIIARRRMHRTAPKTLHVGQVDR